MTTVPFDAAAPDYDETFSDRQLGKWLRTHVRTHVGELVKPGDQILELGCGTGEDAVWLAKIGATVVATDSSEEMLARTGARVKESGLADRVTVRPLDLAAADLDCGADSFYGVFSNFGALNCIPDRTGLARKLGQAVRPGGFAALVLMGPFCAWETGWHLAHLEVRMALRRFQRGGRAHVGNGHWVRVWYPTPLRIRREFTPYFRHRKTVGIGAFLPPSYLSHLVDRWPRPFEKLAAWDRKLDRTFPLTWLSDHYLVVFERNR